MNRPRTYEAALHWIAADPRFEWTGTWWRTRELIVQQGGRVWSVTDPTKAMPPRVEALGCTGVDAHGRLAWVGWDFDVGHGKPVRTADGRELAPYATPAEALDDARRLRNALDGHAEIRRSKSGRGLHVRYLLPEPHPNGALGPEIARRLAVQLGLRADAGPLGRQQFWLWTRRPAPGAFELLEALA